MNFFANEGPDDKFHDPEQKKRVLADDYFPVEDNYLLGDVLLLSKPDGTLVPAAVFVADDMAVLPRMEPTTLNRGWLRGWTTWPPANRPPCRSSCAPIGARIL